MGDKTLKEKYLKDMQVVETLGDEEVAHCLADELLCNLLKELGYEDIVESFNKIDKWYA
jgi:hypothetical protein